LDDLKSYADYALRVLYAQLDDCADRYPGLRLEFDRDKRRLSSAVEHHGLRFITETMAAYRKHFDKCLDARRLTPSHLHHFGVVSKKRVIPHLFKGLTLRVFDHLGELRNDIDLYSVESLRQLLGVGRKIRVDCGYPNKVAAVAEFIDIDEKCSSPTLNWADPEVTLADQIHVGGEISLTDHGGLDLAASKETLTPIEAVSVAHSVQRAADYIACCLGHFDPYDWCPRHGPGAVSDQRFGVDKYDFRSWPDRLERVFPFADFAFSSWSVAGDAASDTCVRLISDDVPAKMSCVPKTTKAPRLIAAEPTALQWCQQVIRDYMYRRTNDTCLRKFIRFDDQTKNGSLALEASSSLSHWTIDLSSASDRISCWHVERVFRRSPHLLSALCATRAQSVRQDITRKHPRIVPLRKFSTMGNATTFPVQSLFFLAVCLGAISWKRGIPVAKLVRQASEREVRIFGDDLIVPADCAQIVVDVLHTFRLKVNTAKTFGGSNFRESCGVDAFQGHEVTAANVLDMPERSRPGSIVSCVDVHNNLLQKGWDRTATMIRQTVERLGFNTIPVVAVGSGRFGWQSHLGKDVSHLKSRWNAHLQRREYRALTVHTVEARRDPSNAAGYLRYFIEVPKIVTSATSSLNYVLSRPRVKLRAGWVCAD